MKKLNLTLGKTSVSLDLSELNNDEIKIIKKLMNIMDRDIPTRTPFVAELETNYKIEHCSGDKNE